MMKRNIVSFAILSLASILLCGNSHAQSFSKTPLWVDNFNSFDKDTWNVSHPGLFDRHEMSSEYMDMVKVKGGKLHLIARKGNKPGEGYRVGKVNTRGKMSFTYGKLEVRAKVDLAPGSWPCIWMVPAKTGIYPSAEIDIMEYVYPLGVGRYQTNVHVIVPDGNKGNKRIMHAKKIDGDVSKWHVYTFEWYKDKLVFKLDGKETHSYSYEGDELWPFLRPFYLILSNGFVSEGWGADKGFDESALPLDMKIDWVRYYPLIDK